MNKVRCWAATHVDHRRERNEDAYGMSSLGDLPGPPSWHGELNDVNSWALVADGMGGHPAGDVASTLAVACLGPLLASHWPQLSLGACLEATDNAIRHAMALDPSLTGMGTTIVGMVIRNARVTTFNAGDSTAWLFTPRRHWLLSEEHCVDGAVTLWLGGSRTARPIEFDSFDHQAMWGSRILLCTDGLTNLVQLQAIKELIWDDVDPAKALVDAALAAGGYDNVTVVVVAFP